MVNIWRRRWVTATVGAVLLCGACLAAAGPTRSVDEFGAVPDDGKDDTAAFMAALKACAATPGSTLSLSPGRYDLAMRTDPPDGASPPLLVIKKAQGLTIDGRDAEIVCHDHAPLFWFENCSDVQIRNLKIDYDPLPFTAGQIIADGDGYHDLKVEEHHPMHEGFRVESMLPYDPLRKRMGLIKDDLYQREFPNRIEKISERVLRIPVKRKLFKTGDWVIVRHQIYSKNAFNFTDCQTVTVQDVTVYTCPGMALMSRGGGDVTLRKFNVMIKPGSGRWFSATADATHFSDTRGKVVLEDCLLEGMGDDGVNVHGMYSVITEVIDARTFKIAVAKDKRWSVVLPRPGDVLEIGRGPDPLSPMTTAKVASADGGEDDKVVTIVLTAPAVQPLMSGDVVGNASAVPSFQMRHCTVRRNRARGALIQTRGAIVEDCTFQDNSGAALQLTCDASSWWEGLSTRDVTICNNAIERVNFGMGARRAAIDIFAEVARKPAPQPVHRQILIEGNTIADATGAAIHVGSASDVIIRGNTIRNPTAAAIAIDHSRDIQIAGNTLSGGAQGVELREGAVPQTVHLSGNTGFAEPSRAAQTPQE